MAIPRNRPDFKAFCLRALGDGVLQVNISDEQADDRIDEAFYLWTQFHSDAFEQTYYAHKIVPSTMVFTTPVANSFQHGESILANTSNAKGIVVNTINSTAISFYTLVDAMVTSPNQSFVYGDLVTGGQSGAQGTVADGSEPTLVFTANVGFVAGETILASNNTIQAQVNAVINSVAVTYTSKYGTPVAGMTFTGVTSNATGNVVSVIAAVETLVPGDADNKYFNLPDEMIAVTRIFPPFDSRMSADILFDPTSQFNLSLMSNFTSMSIIPYYVGRSYQQLLNDIFRGRPGCRFSRHKNRIYIDDNWVSNFVLNQGLFPNSYIIVDGYKIINPDEFPDIWSDRWLQRYTIALLQRQWGMNLSKFGGITLPGGVTLNGDKMKTDAQVEIDKLEKELDDKFTGPPVFFTG